MKVGDYVRTKHLGGSIEKVIKIIPKEKTEDLIERYITDISAVYSVAITPNEVIKSSPNIIDLIEVGDYVNGYKVIFAGATTWDNDGKVIDKRVHIYSDGYDRWLSENFIKSIVTHEQFESMEYKL